LRKKQWDSEGQAGGETPGNLLSPDPLCRFELLVGVNGGFSLLR
jgi:hypothetical protein